MEKDKYRCVKYVYKITRTKYLKWYFEFKQDKYEKAFDIPEM